MPHPINARHWSQFFLVAAIFNYAIGLPIIFARQWSYGLAYAPSVDRGAMALRLWADFGIFVVLIGLGYHIVSRDVEQNRGIVLLGILAKIFDVVNLTSLYALRIARPVVLLPALSDAIFTCFFVIFWYLARKSPREATAAVHAGKIKT